MSTINRLRNYRLTNAQHFAFVDAFIRYAQSTGFSATKILNALTTLVTVFGTENDLYMLVKASEVIALKEAADRRRDLYYTRLHRLVQAWAGSGMTNLDEAATELLKVFKLYKISTSAQLDEETGLLLNLISDLSTTENLARITTINGTYLLEQLVAANNEVIQYRFEQGVEEGEKTKGALAEARKQTDVAYENVVALIEAYSKVADDPSSYVHFIQEWNGTVLLYQEMLDRKTGTSTASGSNGSNGNNGSDGNNEPGDSTNPGGNAGGNSGGEGGSTGGNSGGNAGGGNDNPGGGDNGGGNSGGGGDDWGNGSDE